MELEKQVVSLDLAKRLKELGVRQESYFWWAKSAVHKVCFRCDGNEFIDAKYRVVCFPSDDYCAAFTVAELGEMIPEGYRTWRHDFGREHPNTGWHGSGPKIPDNTLFWNKTAVTEADARARMMICLIENKMVDPQRPDAGKDK